MSLNSLTHIGAIMSELLYGMMNWPVIEGIEYTDIDNPSDVLGQTVTEHGVLIQAFLPGADKAEVKTGGKYYEMQKMDEAGFYAVLIDGKKPLNYKLAVTYGEEKTERYDAYAFEPNLPMKEIRKFNAGIGYDAYTVLGAHPMKINGVEGVRFAVWAPYAVRVSVVGDFNHWDGRIHQMTRVEDTGIFTIFVPEARVGSLYKYEIKKKGGENLLKTDPYAFAAEKQPGDASVVYHRTAGNHGLLYLPDHAALAEGVCRLRRGGGPGGPSVRDGRRAGPALAGCRGGGRRSRRRMRLRAGGGNLHPVQGEGTGSAVRTGAVRPGDGDQRLRRPCDRGEGQGKTRL